MGNYVTVNMNEATMVFLHIYGRALTNINDVVSGHPEVTGADEDFFVFEKTSSWSDDDAALLEQFLAEFCQGYSFYDEYEADYAKDIL
ncbi:hypothetical protein IAU59_005598 [Kwoniella sp. CBS 9459]